MTPFYDQLWKDQTVNVIVLWRFIDEEVPQMSTTPYKKKLNETLTMISFYYFQSIMKCLIENKTFTIYL